MQQTNRFVFLLFYRSDNAGTYACQVHNCDDPKQTKISGHCLVSVKAHMCTYEVGEGLRPVRGIRSCMGFLFCIISSVISSLKYKYIFSYWYFQLGYFEMQH